MNMDEWESLGMGDYTPTEELRVMRDEMSYAAEGADDEMASRLRLLADAIDGAIVAAITVVALIRTRDNSAAF